MNSQQLTISSQRLAVRGQRLIGKRTIGILLFLLLAVPCPPPTVLAHGGEDHGAAEKVVTGAAKSAAAAVARAERNVQTEAGEFNVRFERVPADPRSGELVQMALRLAEKVEGGFGANEPAPIENASVTMNVTGADNQIIAQNLPVTFENGFYRVDYAFNQAGNFKAVFNQTTADNRRFAVDFPITVVGALVNWYFWAGTVLLGLLSVGAVAAVFIKIGKNGSRAPLARIAPFAIAALLFFAFGTFALAYIAPPSERRALGNFEPSGEAAATATAETAANAAATSTALTVSKESQLLFGIKTAPVETRQIVSGLKTTGTVRALPNQRGTVVPPVAGRIVLRPNLTIGSAVGRGEQVGTVEQILDVSGQTELEAQRLEVEAQRREVEARRLELRNTALALQAQQAEQRANAAQARTRLAQAERELQRAKNLVEVNAVPRRRLEEAQTAVQVAQQEVASANQQVALLGTQIKQAEAGQTIFSTAPSARAAARSFPLTAPVAGIINEIRVTSGSQIEAGAEILNIVNLSTVLLEAQVFERDLPVVRESTRASFTSGALNNEVYRIGGDGGDGRLLTIGQTVNPETRAVSVVYEVKNPLGRLRENNFVEITIDTSGDAEVLAVPKQAVVSEQGQTFVFVFAGGESFERRAVVLGAEGADFYAVKAGLKENDRIVTEGVYQLRSTQPGA